MSLDAIGPTRRGLPIFWRLILAFVLPALVLLALFALWVYYQTAAAMEKEMGARLEAVAQACALSALPEELAFLEPGDETSRTYRALARRLARLRKDTGVRRLYLFRLDGTSLVDTAKGVRIGTEYYQLEVQADLLDRVARRGQGTTLLYRGKDGLLYKTGYAVIRDQNGKVVALAAAEGSASYYFLLFRLGRKVALVGVVALLLLVAVTAFVARRMSLPLRRLARAAESIGHGNLHESVDVSASGEVGLVAAAMEQMRRELRERDEQMKMMLAGVAHEVRNPLAGMELSAGLLRDDLSDDLDKQGQVDAIIEDLHYLGRVVQDFLGYARWVPEDRQNEDLGQMVEQALDMMRLEADAKRVHIDRAGDEAVLPVTCDPDAVRRTILNLLRNALQATESGGRIVVAQERIDGAGASGPAAGREDAASGAKASGTSRADRRTAPIARVVVWNSGVEISSDLAEKIFEPFFTTKQQGSGLGLALGKKVADAHGGALYVREPTLWSASVDGRVMEGDEPRGAEFVLEFPLSGALDTEFSSPTA
ncbi:MAG: HAMP domain-containing histidine kinase [Deltaproteobacteria bacterium]|nr:HAMP domain-containing histidine kinase [Deltaproteobacteria bacterium]